MDLGELINTRGVIRLETKDKLEALEQMIEALSKRKEVTSKEKLRRAIKDREKILSTGIGYGVAIPHAKIAQVKKFCAVIGISKPGIPFDAMDGKPVHIIVMIAAPEDAHGEYLGLLQRITHTLKDEETRKRIIDSKDTKSVISIFSDIA
ncbi:MAG: PTS sugar transporter subunit IIA [Planctomycetes bacterium]|nr:PTS sugar transporter subunit IIA [Planctomycetota bacterium]